MMEKTKVKIDNYLKRKSQQVEHALEVYLPAETEQPFLIHEAMRYAVLGNGKRIRPVLAIAVNEMLGGNADEVMAPACALELIHAYSLVHDDLPCLDNDDVRRGKPACHKKYGEDVALLTGDALLTYAFQLLASIEESGKSVRLIREVAEAVGAKGMVGGQLLDIKLDHKEIQTDALDDLNERKTGRLIQVSCLTGAVIGCATSEEERRIIKFGRYLGFAFQIVDDIIDHDGYLRLTSKTDAQKMAKALISQAKEELSIFGRKADSLSFLADAVLNRKR